MKALTQLLRKKKNAASAEEVETRFLRLYSLWHETHDLTLRKKLMVRLRMLMKRAPDFDMRRWFKHAF